MGYNPFCPFFSPSPLTQCLRKTGRFLKNVTCKQGLSEDTYLPRVELRRLGQLEPTEVVPLPAGAPLPQDHPVHLPRDTCDEDETIALNQQREREREREREGREIEKERDRERDRERENWTDLCAWRWPGPPSGARRRRTARRWGFSARPVRCRAARVHCEPTRASLYKHQQHRTSMVWTC